MLSKRQFISLYDQAVLNIRQIKNNNDKLNKNIGTLNQSTLYRQVQSDKHILQALINKVTQLISKMEKNYLDPETARKIGLVKQQLRIQKDRRSQLCENVNQITKQFQSKRLTPKDQDFSPSKHKKVQTSKHSIEMGTNNYYKNSITTNDDYETSQQHQSEIEDYDYGIQKKLIQERAQQLNHASQRMINIKNIANQTSQLAFQQGQKLDIITDDLFMTLKHVTIGNDELDQANKNHRKSKKKLIVISLFLILCVGVFVFLTLAL